jgi:cell division protein ZapA
MKQVEVTILGQSYLLGCPEGADASLHAAVSHVDREMSVIRDTGKVKVRERIAVLAALNLAYALADRPHVNPVHQAQEASEQQQVDQLIHKLDKALSQDGQLF